MSAYEAGAKHCTGCDEPRLTAEFYVKRRAGRKPTLSHLCIECTHRVNAQRRARQVAASPDAWFRWKLHWYRMRATKLGLPFDLDVSYLLWLYERQDGKCAETGQPLTFTLGRGRVPTNCSVDRLDNADGYMRGNVRLTCVQANVSRGEMSLAETLAFYRKALEHHGYGIEAPDHSSS